MGLPRRPFWVFLFLLISPTVFHPHVYAVPTMLLRTACLLGLVSLVVYLLSPSWGSKKYVYSAPRDHILLAKHNDPGRYFPLSWSHKVHVLESTHYRLYTTLLNSDEARTFLDRELEPVYSEFQRLYPFPNGAAENPLAVILLADREEYIRWTTRQTGWSPREARATSGHAWGDYIATYRGSDRAGQRTLRHEAAHQLLTHRLGVKNTSAWFHEGLAVHFERRGRRFDTPFLTSLRDIISSPHLLHEGYAGSVEGRYALAGEVVGFLASGTWQRRFPELLGELRRPNHNTNPVAHWEGVFRRVYNTDIEGIESAWRSSRR